MVDSSKKLLETISHEKCWALTAKFLTGLVVLRGGKSVAPLLGKAEGFITPIWGMEKFLEIVTKIFSDGGRKLFPFIKEIFNIPVEDAVDAAKMFWVAGTLTNGPEFESEIVEATPERVVARFTKCGWMERFKEFKLDPNFRACRDSCPKWAEEGFKVINSKLACKPTKLMPSGDSYCEYIFEFKED
jgi:hypothetical protein